MNIQSVELPENFRFEKLYNCDGVLVPAERAFKNKKIIAFLFSAAWSAECEKFLHLLKQIYQENIKRKYGMEIIYISLDKNEKDFLNYFKTKHAGWYAAQFRDPVAEETKYIFEISTIPQVAVIKASDGSLITKNGREEVQKLGKDVLVAWSY